MVEELNISKTEYIAYLECPLKFYIIKSLNQNKPYGPRGERDYDSFPEEAKEGMNWHSWFEEFYENEINVLVRSTPRGKNTQETKIMEQFFLLEQKRYQENPKYWIPIKKEFYIQTDKYRGQIDRVDQLNEEKEVRIVEYKKRPKALDEQELLFYANLYTEKYPEEHVSEIANYYYLKGNYVLKKLTIEMLDRFKEKIVITQEEILKPNWKRAKNCSEQTKCKFRFICQGLTIPRKAMKK